MTTKEQIKVGAKFTRNNIVFIVDEVEVFDNETVVSSSYEGGQKGNYRDTLSDFLTFINE